MTKKHPVLVLLFLLALASVACNFPTRAEQTPVASGPEATFTSIALTLEVALTQTVQALPPGTETPPAPTLPPTSTAIPILTSTPAPPTAVPCNRAQFVSDVTIADGTIMQPGQAFTKTWQLKNVGSCTWNSGYSVVFESGDRMGAPQSAGLPQSVAPGETVDVSLQMTAPSAPGSYKGNWKLRAASGEMFGIGANAGLPFWAQIEVAAPSEPTVVYSFVDHVCDADWTSNAGPLDCPGNNGDSTGFVVKLNNPKLETAAKAGVPGIETHPLWESNPKWATDGNGWIQGLYPGVNIKSGYHFKTRIGCLDSASSCDVNFRIQYSADGAAYTVLGASNGYNEVYDGSIRDLDFDLSSLSGKTVEFLFQVDANSNGGQDWAVWVDPRIEK